MGSSAKVISAALRLPNGSQISDGLNKKRSDAETTVTSTSSPSSYLSSKAAVRPPKLPPITSTRLPAIDRHHSLSQNTHGGIRDQGRPARSRATGTKVTDAGTLRPDPPRRSRTWRSLTGLEDHRPGGHAYPPLMAGRCYRRPPAFPPCTRPPNTQQQPGTQIGRSGAARTVCRPTATCRQIGGYRVDRPQVLWRNPHSGHQRAFSCIYRTVGGLCQDAAMSAVPLTGQVAVVTGASRGIGKAIAVHLARQARRRPGSRGRARIWPRCRGRLTGHPAAGHGRLVVRYTDNAPVGGWESEWPRTVQDKEKRG